MVSTRQSSNIASSNESYVSGGNATNEASHSNHSTPHNGGKLLRSGLSAPSMPPPSYMPSTSNNEVAVANNNNNNNSTPAQSQQTSTINLLDLPHEILDKIFSFLGYKNVAHLRLVNIT